MATYQALPPVYIACKVAKVLGREDEVWTGEVGNATGYSAVKNGSKQTNCPVGTHMSHPLELMWCHYCDVTSEDLFQIHMGA